MDEVEWQKDGSYWKGKTPCWAIRECPIEVRKECIAYLNPALPCWEQDSYCKKLLGAATCLSCEVLSRYNRPERPGGEKKWDAWMADVFRRLHSEDNKHC